MSSPISIAIITASTRKPRVGPHITTYVRTLLDGFIATLPQSTDSRFTLTSIDLADWPLPFYDEPLMPARITKTADYAHEHTRKWSTEISKHSAFIFVTPQYNWGYPAVLKNAIDFLFNEWKGKPALVVSYGGHGGGKSGAQLQQVLAGCRMQVCTTQPTLAFPSSEATVAAALKGELVGSFSEEENQRVPEGFKELLTLLGFLEVENAETTT